MYKTMLRTGALLAAAVLSLTAQGHECRELGQPNQFGTETKGCDPFSPCGHESYWICTGFAYEDPSLAQPGAGNPNNLDFYPLFLSKEGNQFPLDPKQGDKVDVTATLYYLNNRVYDVPIDKDFNVTVPFFFLGTQGVGYESPIGTYNTGAKKFQTRITKFVQVPMDQYATAFRAAKDFVLPYQGMYQWIIRGTMQRRGQAAVTFDTKWTCEQPRLPYGAADPNDIENTLMDAPEGWFDCVRYPEGAGESARSTTMNHASPPMQVVMNRMLARKSR